MGKLLAITLVITFIGIPLGVTIIYIVTKIIALAVLSAKRQEEAKHEKKVSKRAT